MNNIEKGKLGEEIAAKYIVSKGGKILQNKNWRSGFNCFNKWRTCFCGSKK